MPLGYVIFIERSINKNPAGDRNRSVSDRLYAVYRLLSAEPEQRSALQRAGNLQSISLLCRELGSVAELHIEIVIGDVERFGGIETLAGQCATQP